jgi:hypothetical protein
MPSEAELRKMVLQCTRRKTTGYNGGGPHYAIVAPQSLIRSFHNARVEINNHSYLQPEKEAPKTPETRQEKIKHTKKMIKEIDEELAGMEKSKVKLLKLKERLLAKLEGLERFKSDKEEFAHFLGEMIKSGGDTAQILDLLEQKNMLKNLDMDNMHGEAEEEVAPSRFSKVVLDTVIEK